MTQQGVAGRRRIAEPKARNGFRVESAVFEIRLRNFAFIRRLERTREIRRSFALNFDQRGALLIFAAFFGRTLAGLRYRNAALLRDGANSLRKGQLVHFHHEFENVAACAAAEAVIDLLHGMDGERRSLFLMERAQTGEVLAALFEADVFADDADDVRLLLHALRK